MECESVNERNEEFGGKKRFFPMERPVKEGQVIEVKVEGKGKSGDGVARYENFVVFVKGGEEGKTYKVEVEEVKRTFAIAKIVE